MRASSSVSSGGYNCFCLLRNIFLSSFRFIAFSEERRGKDTEKKAFNTVFTESLQSSAVLNHISKGGDFLSTLTSP